jgi:hypothetical protein
VRSCFYMQIRNGFARLSILALQQRRRGLAVRLPPVETVVRGSLVERHPVCGKPGCKCTRGERHPAVWCLTVTLAPGRTTGTTVAPEQLEKVRASIANYRQLKQCLEEISTINRELLRRESRQLRRRAARTSVR